mmetsp:Transcript_19554/g.30619  ORF Transcript_19554/g.30619 Transcript_19554/m.30619 type:complete len:274 (-) Transcript_19554:35-856(-)|eukprot:CAMPEP_0184288500 /NCGR_PEP_ID=MMETSP1049-20130417/1025_1 /TAXON_ID=77928 /ORGANISM="Proteomonas sulcata, Strain CCMP704" /LENGTH=273 /DNA_ID=CAMNT_0026594933 /DNA_START=75 /DNA_END=896 /DNA_ORIENTATION=-
MFQHANYFLNFSKLLGATPDAKVSFETSQQQILKMYKSGREIPWDLRKAQPALEEAEKNDLFKGVILDAGCGFGDNAIFLAKRGYKVVGFDFSSEAIEIAQDRAQKSGVSTKTEFYTADALKIAESPLRGRKFDTILDCACLQCFDLTKQAEYLDNMASVLKPGGAFVLMIVCNQHQLRSWCRGVAWMEEHVQKIFSDKTGWMIKGMKQTTFLENIPQITIVKGVRNFEPVTPSPCLQMVAIRKTGWDLQTAAAGAIALIAAAGLIVYIKSRR